jgi:hypothetical protein
MKKFFSVIQILGKFIHESGADEQLGDMLLDQIEEFVQRTDNKIDDKLVLPAIKALRIAFDIPDNDPPKEHPDQTNFL